MLGEVFLSKYNKTEFTEIILNILEKGFVGPRGSKGDRGTDGVPGIPGTCLHSCEGFSNLLDAPRTDVVFFNLPPRIPSKQNNPCKILKL